MGDPQTGDSVIRLWSLRLAGASRTGLVQALIR
ncbi:MAG: hypothetical protein QOJ68_616, partial [Blastococcus sp.]|nr:hypothetical protein [Blastococcus sp.]